MKYLIALVLLLLALPGLSDAQTPVYITNARIIDAEHQQILTGRNVLVTGQTITAVGKIKPPAGATIIDAAGGYLMAGMADAHVHFFQSGGLYTRPDGIDLRKYYPYEKEIRWNHDNMEDQLRRYVRCGITSVYDVGATFNFLEERKQFAGQPWAPDIFMTGPLITSYLPPAFANLKDDAPFTLVKTPEEAREMVRAQLPHHPDFIKIWYIASLGGKSMIEQNARNFLPAVQATIEEAHKNNLKVAVHATERITAQLAVEAGADYLVHSVEDEVISQPFIDLLRSRKVVLCPTLIVEDGYANTFGQTITFSSYEIANANPTQLGSLLDLHHLPDTALANMYRKYATGSMARTRTTDSIRMVNLKKLADAGVTIVSGTDAGNIGTLHASSYFSELQRMKESGMTNWQVLQASTSNAGKILADRKTGQIAPGYEASLVLLGGDPTTDLGNLQKIQWIINKGVKLNPDSLVPTSPEALVQQQLNAYNMKDLDAFLATYAEDAELYDFPDKLICRGREAMRKTYAFLQHAQDLHCEIRHRIVQGNNVIDEERVTGGGHLITGTALYQVENGKIRRVYFLK